jgi:ubiquinone/menaquinone biosynthesis C-methylase UbiE
MLRSLVSPLVTSHDDAVKREFAKQAASFEDPGYSFADRRLMSWIMTHVPSEPGMTVLDVAGGTGHMARAYAETVALAVVLDLTPEMLAAGKREADARGLRNLLFVCANATRMPFIEQSFDLVVSRFAVHHFEQPAHQIREMARVCRPGGRVAIVDLVATDEALGPNQDRLERMRDPSHTRALPVGELAALLEDAGLHVMHRTYHDQLISIERWLSQAHAPGEIGAAIRSELQAELDGGPPTGMRPEVREGKLHQTQRWAILVAQKPSE